HAKDYVKMQWLMLQQETPEDFVIATGKQYSVRDFVNAAAAELGITLKWQGTGVEEQGIIEQVQQLENKEYDVTAHVKPGDVIVQIDPRYFRPTEVETLLGDATKAKEKLGWVPKISFAELVSEMVKHDMDEARRDALCQHEGFRVNTSNE
ncbi:MAG TPA: GDP-mannose 4,6-dehydratase, partial [Desulfocapsa sulfexigens]|nr:GDP-mannose 4,6-dehydratase [Desulfocapsa sulfexigens]